MQKYAKAWAAIAGFIGQLVAYGLIDGNNEKIASAIVAAVTAFFVYYVPNKPDTLTTKTGTHY